MMELNREDVVKALDCCVNLNCKECPYYWKECPDLSENALSLIKKLTEENARYKRYYFNHEYDQWAAEIKAETVRKMQEKISAKSEYGTINISPWQLDQIAKELLEDNDV